jgi:hypothetical protein
MDIENKQNGCKIGENGCKIGSNMRFLWFVKRKNLERHIDGLHAKNVPFRIILSVRDFTDLFVRSGLTQRNNTENENKIGLFNHTLQSTTSS